MASGSWRGTASAGRRRALSGRRSSTSVLPKPIGAPMTISALAQGAPPATAGRPFPREHPWDRNFFALWVALIWFGVGLGFIPEIHQHVVKHETPFEPIVHLHGAI